MIQRFITAQPGIGRVIAVAGIAILALWAYYFAGLVRPTDLWDLLPLPVALVAILAGLKLAQLDRHILANIGISYRRDLVIALVVGTAVELSLWGFLFYEGMNHPETVERYIDLERLQEPGMKMVLAISKYSYVHLGVILSVYLGSVVFFVVLIGIWSLAIFTLLLMVRFLRLSDRTQR